MKLINRSDDKKKKFPEALKRCHGIVTNACAALNMSRNAYYKWRNDDPEFAAECDEATEATIDFVESKLMENIDKNDNACIIFFMKTKGRHRGYIERVEHGGINSDAIKHNIELTGQAAEAFDRSLSRRDAKVIAEYKATQGV